MLAGSVDSFDDWDTSESVRRIGIASRMSATYSGPNFQDEG